MCVCVCVCAWCGGDGGWMRCVCGVVGVGCSVDVGCVGWRACCVAGASKVRCRLF